MSGRGGPAHPLLLEEIVRHIFGYLDSYPDLQACYDVCALWRTLAPPQIVRTRPPVTLRGNLEELHGGRGYLEEIGRDPSLLASKFIFIDVNLDAATSPQLQQFLEVHGVTLKQLELKYAVDQWRQNQGAEGNRRRRLRRRGRDLLSKAQLYDLLANKLPNLERLILTSLPLHFEARDQLDLHNDSYDTPDTKLKSLKQLEINIEHVGHPTAALLLSSSPKLEELSIRGMAIECDDVYGVNLLLTLFQSENNLRRLKIENGEQDMLETMIAVLSGQPGLLTELEVEDLVEVSDDDGFNLGEMVRDQAETLVALSIPATGGALNFPPMPNLLELRIRSFSYYDALGVPPAAAAPNPPPIEYSTAYPRLQLLGLNGPLDSYIAAEIFPANGQPAPSVQILQDIPTGVDRALMATVARLFPNLTTIASPIPRDHEDLLVAVWEGCPNLEELHVVLDNDGNEETPRTRSLDSIFSGIPETECEAIRLLKRQEWLQRAALVQQQKEGGAGHQSVRNLRALRILTLRLKSPGGSRTDKLTNVAGYSSLGLAGLSPSVVFMELDAGVVQLSDRCVDHVCEATRLQLAKLETGASGISPPLRFIKQGLGLERLSYPLPPEWCVRKGRPSGPTN